ADGLRVGLIGTLSDDHVHQLSADVDVGFFDSLAHELRETVLAGTSKTQSTGFSRLNPRVATGRLEALHVREICQNNVTDLEQFTIGVIGDDRAVRRDAHAGVFTSGVTVLAEFVVKWAAELSGTCVIDGDLQVGSRINLESQGNTGCSGVNHAVVCKTNIMGTRELRPKLIVDLPIVSRRRRVCAV